jgi:hypothetical protein
VEVEAGRGVHVGQRGEFVEQQGQAGALPEVGWGRASAVEAPGLSEELLGEGGAMAWGRARHRTSPGATGQWKFGGDTCIIGPTQSSGTLQLFVKRTT